LTEVGSFLLRPQALSTGRLHIDELPHRCRANDRRAPRDQYDGGSRYRRKRRQVQRRMVEMGHEFLLAPSAASIWLTRASGANVALSVEQLKILPISQLRRRFGRCIRSRQGRRTGRPGFRFHCIKLSVPCATIKSASMRAPSLTLSSYWSERLANLVRFFHPAYIFDRAWNLVGARLRRWLPWTRKSCTGYL
jgi:hypothetical protein